MCENRPGSDGRGSQAPFHTLQSRRKLRGAGQHEGLVGFPLPQLERVAVIVAPGEQEPVARPLDGSHADFEDQARQRCGLCAKQVHRPIGPWHMLLLPGVGRFERADTFRRVLFQPANIDGMFAQDHHHLRDVVRKSGPMGVGLLCGDDIHARQRRHIPGADLLREIDQHLLIIAACARLEVQPSVGTAVIDHQGVPRGRRQRALPVRISQYFRSNSCVPSGSWMR